MAPHQVVFWSLCALIALLPLPFGSTAYWALAIFQVAVFALAAVHLLSPRGPETARVPVVLSAGLAVFLGFSLLQIVPLPEGLVANLSPGAHAAHLRAAALVRTGGGWRPLSLSPVASAYELLKYAAYALFGFLVYKHVRSRMETKAFVLTLVGSAVFEAFYGLLELFGKTERIFGYKRDYHLGSATGTFINRDHFAGFLEMALPLALGYLLARADFFALRRGFRLREKFLWFSQERLQKTVVIGMGAAVIGLGIVFSRSRTGIFIFAATILLMLAALSASAGGRSGRGEGHGRTPFARVLRTVALLVVFSAALIGIRPVIERFSWANIQREERPIFFRNTIALIGAFPLAGVGPGAFIETYPAFDRRTSGGVVDHAHNDYLEVLAESGLVAGGALILLALGTWAFLFARWMVRTDNFDRGVVLGAVLGILAILVHSLMDFNLRIPSNAAVFSALYGLALRKTLEDPLKKGRGRGDA